MKLPNNLLVEQLHTLVSLDPEQFTDDKLSSLSQCLYDLSCEFSSAQINDRIKTIRKLGQRYDATEVYRLAYGFSEQFNTGDLYVYKHKYRKLMNISRLHHSDMLNAMRDPSVFDNQKIHPFGVALYNHIKLLVNASTYPIQQDLWYYKGRTQFGKPFSKTKLIDLGKKVCSGVGQLMLEKVLLAEIN